MKCSTQIKDLKHPLHYILPPVKVLHSQTVLYTTYPHQLLRGRATRYGQDLCM